MFFSTRSENQDKLKVDRYLYTLHKIYFENIFIDYQKYSIQDLYNYFSESLKQKNTDQAFRETLYKFVEDPYLEIKNREIFESNYYRERRVEEDLKVEFFEQQNVRICYISLLNLSPNMGKKYREYLKNKIDEETVIIIDLTNNFGGSLWTAAFFIALFFEPNTYLFSTNFKKKDGVKTYNFYSSEEYGGYFSKNFVAVLQDETTASSAEVISGVLKTRALVFGNLTYGKPYIQSIIDIENLTVVYTNGFASFSLDLNPHDRVKPDFYLTDEEISRKIIKTMVFKIYFSLRTMTEGG